MTITHISRDASIDEIAAEMDRRGVVIEALEKERDALACDIAMRGHELALAYEIREALGWNRYTSLDIMPGEVRRLRKIADVFPDVLAALKAILEERRRDDLSDPDQAFTDEARERAWKDAHDAVAKARA